jgi:nucleotide-binding universal stress UspA family protein
MSIPKTILVPSDFSKPSTAALEYALDLAAKLGATVHVVHAYELPLVGLPSGVITITAEQASQIIAAAEKHLADIVTRYGSRGVPLTTSLDQTDPRDAILETATKVGADLIVMGTHGRRGVARALIGSVAEQLVRTSHVPVLTVHAASS